MTVQSVDRALSILEMLAEHPEGIGIIELSEKLQLPKSTTHRLLKSLIARDFVYQHKENERYYASMKIAQLSTNIIDNIDIRQIARPYIEQLARDVNEVVHVCIRDGDSVVYIDKVESNRTLRMFSQIGKRAMLHCTGVGKVLLSGLSNEKIQDIILHTDLTKFTEATITSNEELFAEMENIRENKFSLDREEHEDGIYCIAAPIKDYTGKIVAAFSISGPVERIKDSIENGDYKEKILETSKLISHKLGYQAS